MPTRITVRIDQQLLERARRALRRQTARATVEEALRRAADAAEDEQAERVKRQHQYLKVLAIRGDLELLASGQMWR